MSSIGVTAPPPKLWVFSSEMARVETKNGPMSGANILSMVSSSTGRPTQVRMVSPVNAPCAPSSARAMCADASQSTSSPDPDEGADGEHVGHRPGGREERGLLAEQPGDPLLERADGGVLAVDVVADLGARHRGAHRLGGTGDGVAAEVDHASVLGVTASISATRKASSSDCTRLSRGSQTDS